MQVTPLKALKDNYIYVIHEAGEAVVIDPSEAVPVIEFLKDHQLNLRAIWNTHHHWDHVGGNAELAKLTGCEVLASEFDRDRVPGVTGVVGEGKPLLFREHAVRVISIPGHTLGHVAYYFEQTPTLFSGDTLFSLGCGRLFEGTPEQMWQSLEKLKKLVPETRVYCGHEYTLRNAQFALRIEPENKKVKDLLANAETNPCTMPSRLADELSANPFLRVDQHSVQRALGKAGESPVEVFKELRLRKDNFS